MKQKLEKKKKISNKIWDLIWIRFSPQMRKKKKTHGNALLWNWDTPNERWPFKKKTTNGCLNKKRFVENEKTDDATRVI